MPAAADRRRPSGRGAARATAVLVTGALVLLAAVPAYAQGHDHGIDGPRALEDPVVLRMMLLGSITAVTGFALVRPFLPPAGLVTRVGVAALAALGVLLELMLGGRSLAPQVAVIVVLVSLCAPVLLVVTRDDRLSHLSGRTRKTAPWLLSLAAVGAMVLLASAWFGGQEPDELSSALHGGVIVGLAGLAWFTVCEHRPRTGTLLLRGQPAVLSLVVLAALAHATVIGKPYPASPGVPAWAKLAIGDTGVGIVVAPHRPGWNLVHTTVPDVTVDAGQKGSVQVAKRPGTQGGWGLIQLPEGRSELTVQWGQMSGTMPIDTGYDTSARPELAGTDGPECMSALVGAALAGNPAQARCPADDLSDQDKRALLGMTDFLARRQVPAITLVTDASPRSVSAERAVRAEAGRRGLKVATPDQPTGPVFVVSGWESASAALHRVARGELPSEGAYLAPWLLTAPLLSIPAGQLLPLDFNPTDELPQQYVTQLRTRFPGEPPTAAGYRAWAGNRQPAADKPRLYAASTINTLLTQDHHRDATGWLPGGAVTAVTGPLGER
ncbi:DUF6239 family natural product biosynthesis protein [Actinosynnema sp. ALI-1.44]|uniref:DUF6239 family natural product biosynthesis protein n=1 Tax=Actinosynnema sp. ALI-1.44 TaxID=1933779 RepID=UPI0011779A4F|nr:DUF6239 family natural product biosynthesis protein [Actinosynnema sp. ALI-1.44]